MERPAKAALARLRKNRRQDGVFYWVLANASPCAKTARLSAINRCAAACREGGETAASAYRRIREGDSSIVIRHGQVPGAPIAGPVLWAWAHNCAGLG